MKKRKIITKIMLVIPIVIILLTNGVYAHSGRTDSSGGHRDNKNKSGLGSYHYHCGGHPAHLHSNGVCPYSTSTSNNNTTALKETVTEVLLININQIDSSVLEIGQKIILSATITPEDATNKTITWESSNQSILTVNSNGEVEAIAPGTAEIIAKSNNGKTSSKTITVKPKPVVVEQIILSKTNIIITKGEELEIIATILPDNATNKSLTWSSSDTKVASVVNGKVKAKGEGTTIITVISEDNVQAQCTITVNKKQEDSSGTVGAIGGLGVLGIVGAVLKSKFKK